MNFCNKSQEKVLVFHFTSLLDKCKSGNSVIDRELKFNAEILNHFSLLFNILVKRYKKPDIAKKAMAF